MASMAVAERPVLIIICDLVHGIEIVITPGRVRVQLPAPPPQEDDE